MHVSIGNFKYLETLKNAHVVASFFKYILKTLVEPVVTFDVYDKLKAETKKSLSETVLIETVVREF